MSRNAIIGLLIAVLLIGGIAYVSTQSSNTAPITQATSTGAITDTSSSTMPTTPATTGVVIHYTAQGFSPQIVSMKKGANVTFINDTANPMWVASDVHPTHEGYSGTVRTAHCPDTAGTAFDQCASGNTYTFTFGKVGTWEYHNHARPQDTGAVTVTE